MLKNIKNYLQKNFWSPYIAGISIGTLAVFSIVIFKKTIGTSVAFVKFSAFLWYLVNPQYVQNNAYYMSYLKNSFWIDWQIALIIGLFLGAYLAGKIARKSTSSPSLDITSIKAGINTELEKNSLSEIRACQTDTQKNLSTGTRNIKTRRYLISFLGGIVLLLGARFAGGCTSGHAISGGLQMAISSWLYMGGLFFVAIPSALIIYRTTNRTKKKN